MALLKSKRQQEIEAQRAARAQMRKDYDDGFRAAMAGEPLPAEASKAYATGYSEALSLRLKENL